MILGIKAGIYAKIGPIPMLIQNSPLTQNNQSMIITSNNNILGFETQKKNISCAHTNHISDRFKKKSLRFSPAKVVSQKIVSAHIRHIINKTSY